MSVSSPACPDVERRHVRPADAGLDHLRHFGFFKRSAESLRGELVDWLMNPPAPWARGRTWDESYRGLSGSRIRPADDSRTLTGAGDRDRTGTISLEG